MATGKTFHGWDIETGIVSHGPYKGHPFVRLTKKGREDVLTIGRIGIAEEIMLERATDSAAFQELEKAETKEEKQRWGEIYKQVNTEMRVNNRLRGQARAIREEMGLDVSGRLGDITR